MDNEIVAGLKEAMLAERAGIEFYRTAAERTVDERGREVFTLLAGEEERHLEYLQRQFGHLLKGMEFEPLPETPHFLDKPGPIFSAEITARLNNAHWEMTALAVGMALEQSAIRRYQELAGKASSESAREFFLVLVRWEQTHARALEAEYERLKQSYWEQAHFAPF